MKIKHFSLGASLAFSMVTFGAQADTVDVVTSFTILADVVNQVGGEHVNVHHFVGDNGDPHKYEPSPKDVAQLKNTDVIFISDSSSFEMWFERLAKSADRSDVVSVSKGIETHTMTEDGDVVTDPHVWNDPRNVKVWVKNIEEKLVNTDPKDAKDFHTNAANYLRELDELDRYARTSFKDIPASKRKVLTSHDAFSYMGSAYNITFLAPLGVSTDAEASAQVVGKLIKQIRDEGIHIYFTENSNDPRLAKQIANETGAQEGGELYPESLSKIVPTYSKMFKYNVDTLGHAMKK